MIDSMELTDGSYGIRLFGTSILRLCSVTLLSS